MGGFNLARKVVSRHTPGTRRIERAISGVGDERNKNEEARGPEKCM